MKAPIASAMPKPPLAPATASTAAPGVLQAIITGFRSQSDGSSVRQAHARAERPHPGADLRRRRAERLRGLEDDRHRAGEADQHGDEAGGHGRQGNVREARGAQISTFAPSSTTRLAGRRRKSAAAAALRCMPAKSFSRQSAMPPPRVGMTMSRDRK